MRLRSYNFHITRSSSSKFQYGQNKSNAKEGGEGWWEESVEIKNSEKDTSRERKEAPSSIHHPSPVKEAPPREEEMGGGCRAVGGVGQSPLLLPPKSWSRWLWRPDHLSWVGRNMLARSSNLLWKAKPPEGILVGRPGEKALKVPSWDSCPLQDMAVPKEHRAPDSKTPLLAASLQDCHTSRQRWYALPGAHYYMPAGGCRGTYSRPHGRSEPLHHSCKRVTIMPKDIQLAHCIWGEHLHYWNPPQKSVLEFLLAVSCVGFWLVQGLGS